MAVWWWTTWSLLLVQGVKGKGTVDTEWRVLFLILLQILSFSFSLPSLTALMPLVPLIAMEGQSFAMEVLTVISMTIIRVIIGITFITVIIGTTIITVIIRH